jgi:hypothetical protein
MEKFRQKNRVAREKNRIFFIPGEILFIGTDKGTY